MGRVAKVPHEGRSRSHRRDRRQCPGQGAQDDARPRCAPRASRSNPKRTRAEPRCCRFRLGPAFCCRAHSARRDSSIALPNALPDNVRAHIPGWLPSHTVSLGLDLQGGSYLLLEVELDAGAEGQARIADRRYRAARCARRISATPISASPATRSRCGSANPAQCDDAKTLIEGLNPTMGAGVIGVGGKAYEFAEPAGNVSP